MSKLAIECEQIETEPVDGFRTFTVGPTHYLVDGSEVTLDEFVAAGGEV